MQDTSTDTEDPDIEGDTEVEEIGTEEPHSSGAMQTEVELQNRATQTYERDFPSQKKASRGTCTLGLKSGSDNRLHSSQQRSGHRTSLLP
ncbi:hypothetical protein KUCAC02_000084 [Chaenocephalus aceratus]|nr:hypothetical protein KUCAC02_000084 [Chaenocephalus aceratus]